MKGRSTPRNERLRDAKKPRFERDRGVLVTQRNVQLAIAAVGMRWHLDPGNLFRHAPLF